MRKLIIVFILLFSITNLKGQNNNTLYIMLDDSFLLQKMKNNNYILEFSILSKDKRFSFDTYMFEPINQLGFDKKNINEIESEFLSNNKKIIFRSDLEKFEPYKLHEFLSIYKHIFFIRKNKKLYKFKSIYKGTVKDVQTLKMDH